MWLVAMRGIRGLFILGLLQANARSVRSGLPVTHDFRERCPRRLISAKQSEIAGWDDDIPCSVGGNSRLVFDSSEKRLLLDLACALARVAAVPPLADEVAHRLGAGQRIAATSCGWPQALIDADPPSPETRRHR